jgi:hypothetical protein
LFLSARGLNFPARGLIFVDDFSKICQDIAEKAKVEIFTKLSKGKVETGGNMLKLKEEVGKKKGRSGC